MQTRPSKTPARATSQKSVFSSTFRETWLADLRSYSGQRITTMLLYFTTTSLLLLLYTRFLGHIKINVSNDSQHVVWMDPYDSQSWYDSQSCTMILWYIEYHYDTLNIIWCVCDVEMYYSSRVYSSLSYDSQSYIHFLVIHFKSIIHTFPSNTQRILITFIWQSIMSKGWRRTIEFVII